MLNLGPRAGKGSCCKRRVPPSDGHRGRRGDKDNPGRRDVPCTKNGSFEAGFQPPSE